VNVDWGHVEAAAHGDLAADPAVPMRDRFADVGAVTAQLGVPGRPADLLDVWYIPGKSLQVVYRIGGDILRVRFLPPGAGDTDAPVRLPDWNAVGWWFPADPDLPELSVLGRIASARVLSYLPGERCTLRARSADGREIVLKVEPAAETGPAAARLAHLWNAPGRRFAMAEPLGRDAAAGQRWEAFVAGRRIDADLSDRALRRVLPAVARELGALHGTGVAGLEPLEPAAIVDRIERKVLPRIDGALPQLSDRARRLVAALAATAPPDTGPRVTLHGDLHTANVLAGPDGAITFVDLDALARGHPAFDLALLAGRFLLIARTRGADVARVARAVAALPRAYAEAGGVTVSDADFAWYMAAHLLGRQLRTCIRHWVPGVGELAPQLLAWAEATLAAGRFDVAATPARSRPFGSIASVVGPMSK
jgi:phosphotransferase family enzyme